MNYERLSPRYYQHHIPANRWWGKLLRWALGPVGLIGIVSLFLLTISFYFAYHVNAYNSDAVILQNALLYWEPLHHITYFSDAGASYVDKIPLYWLVGRIFSPGRHALFVDGLILTVGNFILFYWASVYLLRKAGLKLSYWTLTPFLWLSSFGFAVTEFFVDTNYHNIEVGIIFATCALAAKIYYGDLRPLASLKSVVFTVLCSAVLGYTIVGDRYIFYYGLIPIIACAAGIFAYKQSVEIRKRIGLIFGLIILSLGFAIIIQLILSKLGIDFLKGNGSQAPQFVEYSSIYANFAAVIYSLFVIFGANFWGNNVLTLTTVGAVFNTVLLILIVCAIKLYSSSRSTIRSKITDKTTLRLMSIVFMWSIFMLTISNVGGTGTYHYLIDLPFIGVVLLVGFLATTSGTSFQLIAALLVIATFLNIGANYYYYKAPASMNGVSFASYNQGNNYNYDIMLDLKAHNLTKGYGNYWDANITSYLSGGKVDIMPTLCVDFTNSAKDFTYKWLMTSSQLSRPTTKTFFLFDPHFQNPPNCPTNVVRAQFGKPSQVFTTNGATVYVYDRNIVMPYNKG